jgi:diaminopimelate decarboxylase
MPAGLEPAAALPAVHHERDGVAYEALAQACGTPLYVYSASAIRARIGELQVALAGLDALVCYAVKANPVRAILALVAGAGLGADVVSAGEMQRALAAGIPARRIVFSGVGKRAEEIDQALAAGIARFNVESRDELELLQHRAAAAGTVATASVRINPDVDAGTHAKISTGRRGDKFGVGLEEARHWFASAATRPAVRLDGLHVHIGSQILDAAPFRLAFARVEAFRRELHQAGHAIACLDIGGGPGVRYRAGDVTLPASEWIGAARAAFAGFDGRLLLEPGRWLVAEAGVLLARVIRVKPSGGRHFLVLDAAMNDLQRPSLYDAWHDIVPLVEAVRPLRDYDVVGPVCETGDTFARARRLRECVAGDLVLIEATGAYGASMASTYNSRPLAAEVLVDRGRWALVRRRQSFEEMTAGEMPAPAWQGGGA